MAGNPDATNDGRTRMAKTRLLGALRVALSALLLVFVGRELARSWGDLRAQPLRLSPGWAALSFAGLFAFLVVCSEAWRRWVLAVGEKIGAANAFRIMYTANLAKYLPGGVWGLVGQVALCRKQGLKALPVSIAVLLEMAGQVAGATLALLPSLSVLVVRGDASTGGWIAHPMILIAFAAAIAGAMHPRVMNLGLALAQAISKRPMPRIHVRYRFILTMLVVYAANGALFAAAFACLGRALSPVPLAPTDELALYGAFLVSWNVGAFAFFLPAGLGAREAALVVLLAPRLGPGVPATLALASRVWLVLGELAAFAVATTLLRGSKEPHEPAPTTSPPERPSSSA